MATVGDRTDQKPLAGQVALVTGGGRGIGRGLAIGLAEAGAKVAALARTSHEVQATADEIRRSGGEAIGVGVDVTDRAAVERAAAEIERSLGPIDLLVNNAARFQAIGTLWETDPEDWWREVEVNLRGPYLCCHAVIPGMVARRRGRIINLVSGVGAGPLPGSTAYFASKAALVRMTDSLAAEVSEHGVKVFAMSPGVVRTSMTEALLAIYEPWEWMHGPARALEEGLDTPIGQPVRLVVRLASGEADALSGQHIGVSEDLSERIARTG